MQGGGFEKGVASSRAEAGKNKSRL